MCHYWALLEKTNHKYTPEAWPDVRDMKIIIILKQIVSKTTPQHIEMEENQCAKMGYQIPVDEYIRWAEEHEGVFDQRPKKQISSMIQMATMARSIHSDEARQNHSELRNLNSNKTWVDRNKDMMTEIHTGLKNLQLKSPNHQMNTAALSVLGQSGQNPQFRPQQEGYRPQSRQTHDYVHTLQHTTHQW